MRQLRPNPFLLRTTAKYVCLYVTLLLKKAVLEALQRSLHNPSTRFAGIIREYVFQRESSVWIKRDVITQES